MSNIITERQLREDMVKNLQERYEKNFVVEEPKLEGNEGFGWNTYIAEARPLEQPDLKFQIAYYKDKKKFRDNYLAAKWSKQGREFMEDKLKEIYGDGNVAMDDFAVTCRNVQENEKNLGFFEILKTHGNDMYVETDCYIIVNDFDKQREAEKMYEILQKYFIGNKIGSYNIFVGYLTNEKKAELLNIFRTTKRGDGKRAITDLYDNGVLLNYAHIKYIDSLNRENPEKYVEVKSVQDIINKLK